MTERGSNLNVIMNGVAGTMALLLVYSLVVTLISGRAGFLTQFSQFGPFIIALAVGFGIQIGMYRYLRDMVMANGKGVIKVTGTTSAIAMASCCTHYLANLIPVLGAVGVASFVAQYQIEFFWLGLIFNFGGIAYMASRIMKFKRNETE